MAMVPLKGEEFEVEIDSPVFEKYKYVDEKRTENQSLDENGIPLWSVDLRLYREDRKIGDFRATIHSKTKPEVKLEGRHTIVTLVDPALNVWRSKDDWNCNLHCYGIEAAKGGK